MGIGAIGRHLGVALVAVTLAACGGSAGLGAGGSGGSSPGGGTTPPASTPQLENLTITVGGSASTSANPIKTGSNGTATVVLKDSQGTPMPNEVVSFSLSSAVGSLSQTTALTNSNGVAQVALTAGATQGAGTLTASYSDGAGNTTSTQTSFAVQINTGTSGVVLTTPQLLDASNAVVGTTANPVTGNNPATVKVTLTNGGMAMPNKVIAFTLVGQTGIGALDPASGTALTDNNGVATITLNAGANAGAATLKASYSENGSTTTSQTDFTTKGQAPATPLTLALGTGSGAGFQSGVIQAPTGLVSGSSATITVNIVDTSDNSVYTAAPVVVTFTSQCLQSGAATMSPLQATTIAGVAQVSYQPKNGCTQDVISAAANVSSGTLTATSPQFSVTQSPANSISFVSASPATIGVKGASAAGVQEQSTLTFLVKDQNGNPVGAGTTIDFTVETPLGGFVLASGASGATNAQGEVTVVVNSGSVPGVGTIKATLNSNPAIYGTGSVSVQQGVATEDRIHVAVVTLNPAAGNHLGVTDEVTVRAADRYGNWVPDGTRINFVTKLGDIEPSCTTTNGTCTVTWTSQGPQTINFDSGRVGRGCFGGTPTEHERNGLPPVPLMLACGKHDLYGVNVISAWTSGEESFSDANGNNQFDNGEDFVDLPEAFQDFDLTGIYQPPGANFTGDIYQDLNTNGVYDKNSQGQAFGTNGSNGTYVGLSCVATATQCQKGLIDVRTAATMVLSTDAIQMGVWTNGIPGDLAISNPTGWGTGILQSATPEITALINGVQTTVVVVVADANGNAPPTGTTITVQAQDKPPGAPTPILGPSSCTVDNTVDPIACAFSFNPVSGEHFVITATSGAGSAVQVTRTLSVSP